MSSIKCDHVWRHMNTIHRRLDDRFVCTFIRIDEFFCERCLQTREVKKEKQDGRRSNPPDWFETKKAETIDTCSGCW